MEHIEIPAHIPKVEAKFFRDALIAMNAGKPLAGLFYLRTFIEQFARRQTGKLTERATGDEIMDAYGALLPERQRDQMPSLKYCYAKLSEPIHAARDDESVFKDVLDQIEHHFDVRRVFKIPDASRSIK
jgi:hypothetical protein